MSNLKAGSVIAAVKTDDDFKAALLSNTGIIFDLAPDILTLFEKVKTAHETNKKLYVHLDLATGVGKDKSGIIYLKNMGVDGIISTRVNIIKAAREAGMVTVQRFFIVDSQSVNTTISGIASSKPDMIEIMPGTVTKQIKRLKSMLSIPVIAGGLIETEEEAKNAENSGADAISTGKRELWNL